jgi:hypothetical protein
MLNPVAVVATTCLLLGMHIDAHCQTAEPVDFRVTLLGTGGPPPDSDRFGPATLVEAGDQKFLFDVGRGTPIRLWQIRVPIRALNAVFLTTSIPTIPSASPT